jgi:peptide/nickel transport system permease protein
VLRYFAKQLLLSIPTILLLTFFVFAIVHLSPGDPAEALLGNTASPEAIAAFRQKMQLDRPLLVQYATWLGQVVRGDLGASVRTAEPVWPSITARLPVTLQLSAYALVFAVLVGVPLGMLAATRRNSIWDAFAQIVGLTGLAMPGFFLALLLILVVSLRFGLLPVSGYVSPTESLGGSFKSLFLPSVTLGFTVLGAITRMTRTSMLEVLGENYIVTARAKGLREPTVLRRHALKVALIPVVTLSGLELGSLLGGTIVIEKIFGLPGIGRLMIDNVYASDFPVVQGVLLLLAVVRLLTNLLTDVLYAVLDPQVRLA